jgi:hypothetical protein
MSVPDYLNIKIDLQPALVTSNHLAVSLSSSSANFMACGWMSDFCKAVHDVVMKIFNTIKEFFAHNTSTTGTATASTAATIIPNPRNLIPFYYGQEANNNHVTLQQILNWDDGQLEDVHNYIQWLFPLATPSGPNPTAPVLDQATIQTFQNDVLLKAQLLRSFRRMLTFYGLQMDEATRVITRAPNFNTRAAMWLTPANHNFLRITRIIHSLRLLGLPEYSSAFLTIMQDIARNEGSAIVDGGILGFWQST